MNKIIIVEDRIIILQRLFGIPSTGIFDSSTVMKMKQPRSGNVDFLVSNLVPNQNRFTHSTLKYPTLLSKDEVDSIIAKAFETWSRPSNVWPPLCFSHSSISGKVDIKIKFEAGPKNGFDGKWNSCSGSGTTVSYSNVKTRFIYFDDHEQWAVNQTCVCHGIQIKQMTKIIYIIE